MTVLGALLSCVVATQHAGKEGADKGAVVAEIVLTESFGAFRDVARFVFLIATVVDAKG